MTKNKHYDTIMAWANGEPIEALSTVTGNWFDTPYPTWYEHIVYRVKKPDIVHETSISLCPVAGPLMYSVSPLEANCVLVFDGATGKLRECTFKGA